MNKLITILLLSTVTCFADNKFVSGMFVSGAMPLYVAQLPDLIANTTNINLVVGGTYQYNNIIITNGGSITITGNTNQWTTIICNNLKVYDNRGRTYDGIIVNKMTYYYGMTVTKTAIDGQYLSASLFTHTLNANGCAGGNGGGNVIADGTNPYLQVGGDGAQGLDYYADTGDGGYFGPSYGGDWGATAPTVSWSDQSSTCGYDFVNAGGGGGGGGISSGLLYLRIKSAFTDTSSGAIKINAVGGSGGNGGGTGLCDIDSVDNIWESNAGDGGAGGSGGVVVQRSANGVYMSTSVDAGAGGYGGLLNYVNYGGNLCQSDTGGNQGNDGVAGWAGTSTHITP